MALPILLLLDVNSVFMRSQLESRQNYELEAFSPSRCFYLLGTCSKFLLILVSIFERSLMMFLSVRVVELGITKSISE